MKHVAKWIMHHRAFILIITILLSVCSVFTYSWTGVSNDLSDFLPEETSSTVALRTMEEEYDGSSIANVDIMVEGVTLLEALDVKAALLEIDGLQNITFLDDSEDLNQPLEYIGEDTVESWYKDHCARFTAYIDVTSDDASDIIAEIKEVVGENGWVGGDGVLEVEEDEALTSDIINIFKFALPLVFLILLLTTSSWFEPVLFFISIGIAILLNQGTNFIMGTISSITATCSMILQMAVSMDYAIFLLDTYNEYINEGLSVNDAMERAIVDAFSSVTSSAITTVIGFLALTIMKFRLGLDLGVVLAKGVLLSLICTLTVLPVLASYSAGILRKTHHRRLIPPFKKIGKVVSRICIPVMLIVVLLAVPAYIAQNSIDFLYGSSVESENGDLSDGELANERIAEVFGNETSSNMLVLMVPRGYMGTERQLYLALKEMDHVTSVSCYLSIADESIPLEYAGEDAISQLVSANYSRIILQTDTAEESDEAFQLVEDIRALAEEYFPGEWLLAGNSATCYDLRETILSDDTLVSAVSIGAIALTIMITFRSLMLPVVLVFIIETAIWMNLSRAYFLGDTMMYMCRLIINSVQLGATVDYAILTANHYMANRKKYKKFDSAARTFSETALSILTSASILAIAGLMLGNSASDPYVAQVGELVGFGAIISGICVLFALPGLLIVFDPFINHLTIGAHFRTKRSDAKLAAAAAAGEGEAVPEVPAENEPGELPEPARALPEAEAPAPEPKAEAEPEQPAEPEQAAESEQSAEPEQPAEPERADEAEKSVESKKAKKNKKHKKHKKHKKSAKDKSDGKHSADATDGAPDAGVTLVVDADSLDDLLSHLEKRGGGNYTIVVKSDGKESETK